MKKLLIIFFILKIGLGPVGTHNISVYNNAKGLAQMNAITNTFTFSLVASSITPTYGGVGGKNFIKIKLNVYN